MTKETAMELQMRLAKEALAMLMIHPTLDVQLYRESIMAVGEAWDLPAAETLEALALIEHEQLAIRKAGEDGTVQHILPEEELPMNATSMETLDSIWDLFETSLRTGSAEDRTVLYTMARTLEETQNLLDWIEKNGSGETGVITPTHSNANQPSRPIWGGSSFPRIVRPVSRYAHVSRLRWSVYPLKLFEAGVAPFVGDVRRTCECRIDEGAASFFEGAFSS